MCAILKLCYIDTQTPNKTLAHGVLSGPAFERINASAIKELIVHNTIPLPDNCPLDKIKQLDVAPIFARAIAHVHGGTSIADLF